MKAQGTSAKPLNAAVGMPGIGAAAAAQECHTLKLRLRLRPSLLNMIRPFALITFGIPGAPHQLWRIVRDGLGSEHLSAPEVNGSSDHLPLCEMALKPLAFV